LLTFVLLRMGPRASGQLVDHWASPPALWYFKKKNLCLSVYLYACLFEGVEIFSFFKQEKSPADPMHRTK
jgi:hypothetical protein